MTTTERGPAPVGLTHLAIRVRDVGRAVAFYSDVLGLTVKRQGERGAFLTASGSVSHELAIFSVGAEAPGPEPTRVGMYHMAWAMASFDDLQALYDHLVRCGANICGFSDSATASSVSFFDPDGNEIEAIYELPMDQWPAERGFGGSFPRPLRVVGEQHRAWQEEDRQRKAALAAGGR